MVVQVEATGELGDGTCGFSRHFFPLPVGFRIISKKKKMHETLNINCCCLVSQSCPTLFNPMDSSLPGSSVHGIPQARTLEWVADSSSRGSSRPRDQTRVSCIGRRTLYH